ncbi:MAG: FxsB family radical SAM/SPASM domain protein [Actinophytocola sp.]|uniref:FxsB family cyclophane-forming radical SAM/SPASM peptide maturase n=1 Tax=Actinophytocola sp. TaxID=1872138 RepID=UPI00132871A7|nr:FxsB family cyclophane-forming radical SAM/SPASM peptide maturase [Actinophytocola sp.]MPZ85165.1 FxsB family radical SAM/SPASM domain protein [Actinophytocola sp.]
MSRASDSAPVPIAEYVLKVASRCNLACDYCYVYTMADQSWRSRPVLITPDTVLRAARRIAEHAATHRQPVVKVVLHGGEPLLAGRDLLDHVASTVRRELPDTTSVDLRIQTNGVLLDESFLGTFATHGVKVGISLDGTEAQHDEHRVGPAGRGSHADTARAIRLLTRPEYRAHYAGLLCVIDIDHHPVEAYEALLEFEPPVVDFLLPHGNWSAPPPGRVAGDPRTPYADWLIAVFDRWYDAPRQETAVRLFQEVINLLLGGRSRSEQVGAGPVAYLVIDTDGSYQQDDSLKSVRSGEPETGMNIVDHTVDEVLHHPDVRARQLGIESLAADCRRCPLVRVCGGGDYPHRFRAGQGFRNPSVYCPDLQRLIRHVAGRVRADLFAGAGR